MALLRSRLESSGCWVYPHEAASQNIYGDLYIRFTITKTGTLGEVELQRTSGHKMLDDAAMRAVRDCGPYWPLPDSWRKDSYSIMGHFVYSLGGYYVR
jgi:protein TonB